MGAPTPRTALQRGNDTEERLQILEGRAGIPGRLTSMGRGSTAERDIYYGSIATSEQQTYLANLRPIWFNTDLGWEESFYLGTGSPGLTAPGLVPTATPGWYPIGRGPRATLYSAGPQSRTSLQQFTNYLGWGVSGTNIPPSNRNCTDDFIRLDTASGAILRALIAGYYDVEGMMAVQGGSGTAVLSLRVNTFDNAYGIGIQQYPVPLLSGYADTRLPKMRAVLFGLGAYAFHYLDSGALQIGHGTSFLSIEYVRPPLVNP